MNDYFVLSRTHHEEQRFLIDFIFKMLRLYFFINASLINNQHLIIFSNKILFIDYKVKYETCWLYTSGQQSFLSRDTIQVSRLNFLVYPLKCYRIPPLKLSRTTGWEPLLYTHKNAKNFFSFLDFPVTLFVIFFCLTKIWCHLICSIYNIISLFYTTTMIYTKAAYCRIYFFRGIF